MNLNTITSLQAYNLLVDNKHSIIIDVRTEKEWKEVGVPVLHDQIKFITWPLDRSPKAIEHFFETLKVQLDSLGFRQDEFKSEAAQRSGSREHRRDSKNSLVSSLANDAVAHDFKHSQDPLFFICKSGGRSAETAGLAAGRGYKCYNIIDGFEGSPDHAGWKQNNLPWEFV